MAEWFIGMVCRYFTSCKGTVNSNGVCGKCGTSYKVG